MMSFMQPVLLFFLSVVQGGKPLALMGIFYSGVQNSENSPR